MKQLPSTRGYRGYISEAALFHLCGRSADSNDARYDLPLNNVLRDLSLCHPPFMDDGSRHGYELMTCDGSWGGSLLHETQGVLPGKMMVENVGCSCDRPRLHFARHLEKCSGSGSAYRELMRGLHAA